jgi:hypothetical protein
MGVPIMFLQIMGMTLMVIGLVGFLIGVGGILYHLFRAEYGRPRQALPLQTNPPGDDETC